MNRTYADRSDEELRRDLAEIEKSIAELLDDHARDEALVELQAEAEDICHLLQERDDLTATEEAVVS